ncbi:MAG TPA: hypothetical protein VEH47_01545 [Candidatus Acidoferrales bacterium]|nr:hypothetical protein [Candidatus Acidoferrales bacterium]
MFTRKVFYVLIALVCFSSMSLGQQNHGTAAATQASSPASAAAQQFPVVLQQKVVAGKTPAGTHVRANLVIATLLNGKVIPRNAVLSGEVIESQAKTATQPSRLSLRMDAAQWKNGSAAIQAYLISWYYPVTLDGGPALQYGPEQSPIKTWNGMGQYPDPNSPAYKPFPSSAETDKAPPTPNTPSSVISRRPVAMKNVEFERNSAGAITLRSARSNLKLDAVTTYILAGGDVPSSLAAK